MANPLDAKALKGNSSFSSLSLSSKGFLSFGKRKRQAVKGKPNPPLTEIPGGEQSTRVQGRRISVRDSIPPSTSATKRTSVRRRASSRLSVAQTGRRYDPSPVASSSWGMFHYTDNAGNNRENAARSPTTGVQSTNPPGRSRRSMLMRRLTGRLHTQKQGDDASSEMPIQRPPVPRRQHSRMSHRSMASRRSHRSSNHRPISSRLSRPISGVQTGYLHPNRPPSSLHAIGNTLEQVEDDSEYSTESETDAPITMRSVRVQRVRASTMTIGQAGLSPPSPVDQTRPNLALTQSETHEQAQLADLIEEITGDLERRSSRDSMDSGLDFSLDHYCNAFPIPPSPGIASGGLFSGSRSVTPNSSMKTALDRSHVSVSASASTSPEPQDLGLLSPTAQSSKVSFHLDLFAKPSDEWGSWSFGSLSPTRVATSPPAREGEARFVDREDAPSPADSRYTPTHVTHQQHPSTTSSSLSSTPATPATSSFARPRSADPLAQARRKTRVMFGHVLDAPEHEPADLHDTGAKNSHVGRSSPLWWDSSARPGDAYSLSDRRGSDKSSLFSVPTPDHPGPDNGLSAAELEKIYSLNDLHDDEAGIGVALTTEERELASPSPISFVENPERPSLFARRRLNSKASRASLRLEPPPMPPLPENSVSVPSTAASSHRTSPSPSVYEAAIVTSVPSEFAAGRTIQPSPPPVSAPAKRKSFFRYPFSSTRRSISHSKQAANPGGRTVSPPLPSPGAVAPPMSANARSPIFPFLKYSESSGPDSAASSATVQNFTHPPSASSSSRPSTPSKFKSFSRPSSSSGRRF